MNIVNRAVVLVSVALIISFVLLPYAMTFKAISGHTQDWANFGAYVGGILTPIIAGLSFAGLLYTISIQRRQITLLQTDSSSNQILKTIDKIDDEINCEVDYIDSMLNISLMKIVLEDNPDILPKMNDNNFQIEGCTPGESRRIQGKLSTIAKFIHLLRVFTEKHSTLTNDHSIADYCHYKYKILHIYLQRLGYPVGAPFSVSAETLDTMEKTKDAEIVFTEYFKKVKN